MASKNEKGGVCLGDDSMTHEQEGGGGSKLSHFTKLEFSQNKFLSIWR